MAASTSRESELHRVRGEGPRGRCEQKLQPLHAAGSPPRAREDGKARANAPYPRAIAPWRRNGPPPKRGLLLHGRALQPRPVAPSPGFQGRGLSLHGRGFPLQDSDSAAKRGLSLHGGGQRLQERGQGLQRRGLTLHVRLWSDCPRFEEPRAAGNPHPQIHRPAFPAEPVPTALRRPRYDTPRRCPRRCPIGRPDG